MNSIRVHSDPLQSRFVGQNENIENTWLSLKRHERSIKFTVDELATLITLIIINNIMCIIYGTLSVGKEKRKEE